MRVLELFAGAGGMALGFHRAGFDTVALAEWDDHARCVLRARFPDVPLYGDVTAVDGREVVANHGPVDLVSGGAPCQDLSVAGKRAGLDGSRSVLFYDLIRIWEETGATYCLYENVCGALSSNKGADFAAVLSAFVGADVPVPSKGWKGGGGVVAGPEGVAAWRICDAQYYGVPQRRRRVFVLGARPGGVDPAAVLLEWEGMCGDSAASSEAGESTPGETAGGAGDGGAVCATGQITHALTRSQKGATEDGTGRGTPIVVSGADGGGGVTTLGALDTECGYSEATFQSVVAGHVVVPALPASGAGTARTDNERTEAELVVVQEAISWDEELNARVDLAGTIQRGGDGGRHEGVLDATAFHENQRGEVRELPVFNSLAGPGGKPGQGYPAVLQPEAVLLPIGRPRRLLPIETERLMGWPDDFTNVLDPRGKPMADSHRYKMCGNGVVSHVAEWIGRRLLWAEANAEPLEGEPMQEAA